MDNERTTSTIEAGTVPGADPGWRYLQLRRTIMYVEQAIKNALGQYVSAPNSATTWAAVNSDVSKFLDGVWLQGGLIGDQSSDSYKVKVGSADVIPVKDVEGDCLIVHVEIQALRPEVWSQVTVCQTMNAL